MDNTLTRCGKAGQSFDLMIEAYAGHYFPESPVASCATGPVLLGSYQDPKTEGERAILGRLTYGVWNEDAYQLFLDMNTLWMLGKQVDPESLRADHIVKALEKATLLIDFEQPGQKRIQCYRAARKERKPVLKARNGSTMPTVCSGKCEPSCGMISLIPSDTPVSNQSVCAVLTETGAMLENEAVHISLNHRGEVVSFVDKKNGTGICSRRNESSSGIQGYSAHF